MFSRYEWNFSSYLVRGSYRPWIQLKQTKGDQACALYAKSIRHTCHVYLTAQFQTCPFSIFQSPLHLNFCNYCWNIYYCRCLFLLIVTLFHALIRELISFLFLNFTSFMFVMFVLTHVIFWLYSKEMGTTLTSKFHFQHLKNIHVSILVGHSPTKLN